MKRTIVVALSLALCLTWGSAVSAASLPADAGWIPLTVAKIEKDATQEGFYIFHFEEGASDEDRYEWTTKIEFYIDLLTLSFKMEGQQVYLYVQNGDVVGGGLIRFPPTDD